MKGQAGKWTLKWLKAPRGAEGVAQVEVSGPVQPTEIWDVRWKRDAHGIWIDLPRGAHGYDIEREVGEDGAPPTYTVGERLGSGRWAGVAFRREGELTSSEAAGGRKKAARVRAQMPGKIVKVVAAEGATVAKGDSLLVMEAMKMENEIRAPQAGRVAQLKITAGQTVETGAELLVISDE